MGKDILKEVQAAMDTLLETISMFSQQQFNTVPFEGSWTAGETAEHVFKAIQGLPEVLQGHKKLAIRKPDEKVSIIEEIFLNFTTKMKSPAILQPTEGDKQKDKLYSYLKAKGDEVLNTAKEMDLTLICTDASVPQMGEFTVTEWLAFMVCHMRRHTHQMQSIMEKLER